MDCELTQGSVAPTSGDDAAGPPGGRVPGSEPDAPGLGAATGRGLALLLAGACAFATLAATPGNGESTFFDSVDVHVVNVDVVVLDRDREPVRGLGREDFELFEDGEPVEITNFYGVDGARPSAEAGAPAEPDASGRPLPAAASGQELHLAIFVDGMTIEPINRRRVFDALREFLTTAELRPASLVLASFDGELEVTAVPRFDPADVDAHLERLAAAAPRGVSSEMDRRLILGELTRAVEPSEIEWVLEAIDSYAEQRYAETQASTRALESLVEALAALPGRKGLVYVSGGLTRNPGEALYYAWERRFPEQSGVAGAAISQRARQRDTSAELLRLIGHANANRVTFYTIAARGLTVLSQGTVDAAVEGFAGQQSFLDSVWVSNLQHPLQTMAEDTGGRAIINANRIMPDLLKVASDFENYYSLGYMPATPGE